MARLASDIEADFNFKRKIKNFEELCRQINGKYIPFVKWMMMAAGICMMYASTITNILLITTTISKTYSIGELPIKLIIFGIITLLLILIVEPEKIQYINIYVTTLLMLLAYLILVKNVYTGFLGDGPGLKNVKMMDIKYTGLFAGNIAYAFEVASNYLSLRLISSNEVKYDQLTKYMMVFVGLNFYLCAGAHLIAFPEKEVTVNSFDMMGKYGAFWKALVYAFMINTLYTFSFNTIFTSEIIESIPFIHNKISNSSGSISRNRLTIMRVVLWLIAVLLSFVAKDII